MLRSYRNERQVCLKGDLDAEGQTVKNIWVEDHRRLDPDPVCIRIIWLNSTLILTKQALPWILTSCKVTLIYDSPIKPTERPNY